MIEQEKLVGNPFPGLRPFEMDEQELFFGRDSQSDEVLSKLRAAYFVAVVGTSGSGKSSLVRASLLPALLSGHMTSAGSSWRIAVFRPGNNPTGNLAKALAAPGVFGAGGGEREDADRLANIERALRRSSLGLLEVVAQARMAPHENLLILADQFEELFRFRKKSDDAHPEDEAAAFVKLLLEAKQAGKSQQERLPIYVILTMRSDYLGDCAHFRGLPEAINEGQYLIPRMNDDARREAVRGPVIIGGGEITEPLVNQLLNDAGEDPAQLPILQHALMRTWDYWKQTAGGRGPIDLVHYKAVGQMSEALSRHADEAFLELSPELQKVAERVFKSLTEKEADNREGRRPATIGEMAAAASVDASQVMTVVEGFRGEGRSFLMPPPSVPLTADTLVDISHESLIRGWQRLREWVDDEAQCARHYRRLADTAALFPEAEGFLRDPALQLGLNWLAEHRPTKAWAERYHPGFDKTVEYLEASRANREAEDAEREREQKEKIERELKHAQDMAAAEKRRAKLRNWMLLCVGLLMLMFAGSTAFAVQQWLMVEDTLKQVAEQKTIAEQERDNARRLEDAANVARATADKERESAVAARNVAEKARAETAEQRDAARRERAEAERQRDAARRATVEAGRQRDIATGALADARKQRDIAVAAQTETQTQRDIAVKAQFVAEQQSEAANKLLATVVEIDRSAPYFKQIMRGHEKPVRDAAFGPDGLRVVTASDDQGARLWDVATGDFVATYPHAGPVSGAAFSPDGSLVATASDAGHIGIWDVKTSASRRVINSRGGRRAVAFSPDGKAVAFLSTSVLAGGVKSAAEATPPAGGSFIAIAETYTGYDNVVELWGLTTNERTVLVGHSGAINGFEFSPDGKYVVTASADSTALVWDAATGKAVGEPRRHLDVVNTAKFSPDGKLVVTASKDGKARVWDAQTGNMIRELAHKESVNSAAFSPRGGFIVTTSRNAAFLWKAKTPDTWAEVTEASPTLLYGHTDAVTNALFSPDGRWVVTISDDRTARLWRAEEELMPRAAAESVAVFRGHIKPLTSVAFSKDSRALLTGSEDRTARVWDLSGLGAFSVVRTGLRAVPAAYEGQCPVTVKFTGTITSAGGSGTVKYRFVRSDGTQSLVQELSFDAPATKEVTDTREVFKRQYRDHRRQPATPIAPDAVTGWVMIRVLEPAAAESNRAAFKVVCRDPDQPQPTAGELTDAQLRQIMPSATDDLRARYLPHLRKAMADFGINTPLRQAAFLTQVAYITGDLRLMVQPGRAEDFKKYDNHKGLGNYVAGDGARFKGRGAFRITGRANYQSLGQLLGVDLIAQPELAETPEVAFRTAAIYWQRLGLNELADSDNILAVSRRLTGGLEGAEIRQAYYQRAKGVLGAAR